jgi:signal transduction histidine kinase
MVYTYGRDFAPINFAGERFRTELVRRARRPVEFYEVSLDAARQRMTPVREDEVLAQYLTERFASHRPDLIVTIGAPAARFVLTNRPRLFPSVPALIGAAEPRMIAAQPLSARDAVVSARLDLPAMIDSILAVRPETRHVTMILGASDNETRWRDAAERDFIPYRGRIDFDYTNDLSLDQIRNRVATLSSQSVILFAVLAVDAAGVAHEQDDALLELSAAARVPMFGLFDAQLGKGIVGGPLVSLSRVGDAMAESAARILSGEEVSRIPRVEIAPVSMLYDWRELARWKIPESRLPPASIVLHRPATLWEQYSGIITAVFAIILLQMAFIAVLGVQHRRLRAAEKETRDLSTRLLSANEDERRRLARDLHDDFSHRIARLSMDAAQLERSERLRDEPRIVHNIREELSHLAEDIHDVSHRLHPTTLEDLGLADALRTECDQVSRSAALKIVVDVDAVPEQLPLEIALCAFRVAQEALRNVSRHARASTVDLSVKASNGSLSLAVRDDGVGFDPTVQRGLASLGHASMRERVRLLGGVLEIHSAPGHGTTIQTRIPLSVTIS